MGVQSTGGRSGHGKEEALLLLYWGEVTDGSRSRKGAHVS